MMVAIDTPIPIIKNDGPICKQACYSPSYIQLKTPLDSGAYELIYTQGGIVGGEFPWADPRWGVSDPIKVWQRKPGTGWQSLLAPHYPHSATNIAFSGFTFPWMADWIYLNRRPEANIGATVSPSIYQVDGGILQAFFPATVGGKAGTPASTKRNFTLFHATSFNGIDWTLSNYNNNHTNVAAQFAALWFGEFVAAEDFNGERGITGVSAMVDPAWMPFRYIRLFLTCWTDAATDKNAFLRTSLEQPREFEIWAGNVPVELKGTTKTWVPIVNGELPKWFVDTNYTVGSSFPNNLQQVIPTPYRFINNGPYTLITTEDGKSIYCLFSQDGINWGGKIEVAGVRDLGLSSILAAKLDRNGDIWHIATNDLGVLNGDPNSYGKPTCEGALFGGAYIAEAKAIYS